MIDLLGDNKVAVYEGGNLVDEYDMTPDQQPLMPALDQAPFAPMGMDDHDEIGVRAREDGLPVDRGEDAEDAEDTEPVDPPNLGAQQQHAPAANGVLYHEADDQCSICLEFLVAEPSARTSCCHNFHTRCLQTWYMRADECPLCRKNSQPIQFLLPPQ